MFRPEANPRGQERLHGSVHLAVPVSWHVMGLGLGGALIAGVAFCCLGTVSRLETVPGVVTTDRGVVAVVPMRTGTIEALFVKDGQDVAAGQVLARINTEDVTAAGDSTQQRLLASIADQKVRLESQLQQAALASAADQARSAATINGFRAELTSLDEQIAVQSELVSSAGEEYAQGQTLSASGFISRIDLQKKRQNLLTSKNALAQAQAQRASKLAAIDTERQAALQASANAQAQLAGLNAALSELGQHAISTDSARAFSVTSAVAGRVTALTARQGQVATSQSSLMQIVPAGAMLTAELYAPSSAVGALSPGDAVRLAFDAYPYQQFGTLDASISGIAATAVTKSDAQDGHTPVYVVSVAIAPDSLRAFVSGRSILPGMVLTARIVTRKERIISALLEPVLSIGKR